MEDEKKSKQAGKRGLGINAKLVGLLLPTIGLVLTLILLVLYLNTSRIVTAKSEDILESNTENVVNEVTAWMNDVVSTLRAERDALEYFGVDDETQLAYIKHVAGMNSAFPAGIYLAKTSGRLLHASFVPGPEYSVFEKAWYQEDRKSVV